MSLEICRLEVRHSKFGCLIGGEVGIEAALCFSCICFLCFDVAVYCIETGEGGLELCLFLEVSREHLIVLFDLLETRHNEHESSADKDQSEQNNCNNDLFNLI